MKPVCLMAAVVCCFIVLAIGCSEDNVTYITKNGGIIYGRAISDEIGITVEVWQAALIKSVTADNEGYFSVTDLAPGIYQVRVKAPSGRNKTISDVDVDNEYATRLDPVFLSGPNWPLTDTWPNDGQTGVSLSTQNVSISSSVMLNLTSLNAEVQFSPAMSGTWSGGAMWNGFEYEFVPTELFRSGIEYTVTISKDLQLASGETLGAPVVFSFTTLTFGVSQVTYPSSQWSIDPANRALMTIRFTAPVDSVTASSHISISPPLGLTITVSRDYYDTLGMTLSITAAAATRLGTTYTLTLGSELAARDGATLGQSQTLQFAIQPLTVESVNFDDGYPYGDTLINPGQRLYCALTFNADVDLDSLNSAVSFDPPVEGFWYRPSGTWTPVSGQFQFFATGVELLAPDQHYTISIDGDAGLVGGIGLGEDWTRSFRTYPVMVRSMYPSPGSRGVSLYTNFEIEFNVAMDHGATESAFEFTQLDGTPVPGSISWYSYGDGERLRFDPDLPLTPGAIYTMKVTTSAMSTSGVYLKEAGYTFFEMGD